jgi:hypothetical protein
VVLRRGADHRRPADVDVLDRGLLVDVIAGDGLLEGVEVDRDQVDRLDPLGGQRVHMGGVVAPRQERRVEARVQRLHPPVEDLLLAGELGDVGDLEPGVAERRGGAAGREDLHPERRQRPGEVGDPGLVGDRDQGAAYADRAGRAPGAVEVPVGVRGCVAHRSATRGGAPPPILCGSRARVRIASG